MGFSLGDLILSATLFANAVAILNDERFLKKCLCPLSSSFSFPFNLTTPFSHAHADGWGYVPGDVPDGSMKSKIVFLLYSIRTVIRSLSHPLTFSLVNARTTHLCPLTQSRCSS